MSYDISKLYIKIDEHKEGESFVESTAELSSFKEFIEAGDTISKIAILSTDVDSPFVRIKERSVMMKAIFDFLLVNDEKLLKDIIEYKNELFVNCWVKYLYILNEIDFTDWMLAKKDYEYFLLKSTEEQGKDEPDEKYLKKRNQYRTTISDLGATVKNLESKIFPDSKAAREASLAESKRKIKLYCEMYSEPFHYC